MSRFLHSGRLERASIWVMLWPCHGQKPRHQQASHLAAGKRTCSRGLRQPASGLWHREDTRRAVKRNSSHMLSFLLSRMRVCAGGYSKARNLCRERGELGLIYVAIAATRIGIEGAYRDQPGQTFGPRTSGLTHVGGTFAGRVRRGLS